jgi:hypothetical protein
LLRELTRHTRALLKTLRDAIGVEEFSDGVAELPKDDQAPRGAGRRPPRARTSAGSTHSTRTRRIDPRWRLAIASGTVCLSVGPAPQVEVE